LGRSNDREKSEKGGKIRLSASQRGGEPTGAERRLISKFWCAGEEKGNEINEEGESDDEAPRE